jgi:hypothetical protein
MYNICLAPPLALARSPLSRSWFIPPIRKTKRGRYQTQELEDKLKRPYLLTPWSRLLLEKLTSFRS